MALRIGIDIGSTTVKVVVLDAQNKLLFRSYERHYSKTRERTCETLRGLRGLLGGQQVQLLITGSAGLGVAKAAGLDFVQEVYATAAAVREFIPGTDAVIELGGEDAKIIFFGNLAGQYVQVCACGVVFICGYNAISAVLRGCGDSKSPLLFVAVAGCMNVVGDIFLVKYFHMGVRGTAFATIFSQGFSMVCAALYLNKRKFIFQFRLKNFRMDRGKAGELIKVGIPISFQECMVRLSFLYLTSVTNALGVAASSAVGIAGKYDVFAMLPATSAASALASIVAQNYGARKYDRMNRALWIAILAAAPFSLAFFLWAQISPETMIGVFSKDTSILEAGIPFFRTCSFDYLAVLFVFSMNGYLNGRGKTIFTMISCCLGALALRIPLLVLACRLMPDSLGIIGAVAPTVSAVMAVYTCIYVLRCRNVTRV